MFLNYNNNLLLYMSIVGITAIAAILCGYLVSTNYIVILAVPVLLVATLFIVANLPELPILILTVGMPFWRFIQPVIPIQSFAVPATLALFGMVTLYTLVRYWKSPRNKLFDTLDATLLAFFIWMALSTYWTSNYTYGTYKVFGFAAYSLIPYFLVRYIFLKNGRPLNFYRLAHSMILFGLGHVIIVINAAIASGAWSPITNLQSRLRVIRSWEYSIIGESDILTLTLLANTVLLIVAKSWKTKIYLILTFIVQFWAFASYQQRGASLALIAGFFLIVVCYKTRWSRTQSFIFASLATSSILFVLYYLNPQFGLESLTTDSTIVGRLERYSIGWQTFWEHPFIGVGIGGMAASFDYSPDSQYVHNKILEIIGELGLVGAFWFVIFTFQILIRTLRTLGSTLKNRQQQDSLLLILSCSCLAARYVVGMSSGDLALWNIGVWMAIISALYITNTASIRSIAGMSSRQIPAQRKLNKRTQPFIGSEQYLVRNQYH